MNSELPKPLHEVCGRSMLHWVVEATRSVATAQTVLVVGHGQQLVRDHVNDRCRDRTFLFAEQKLQRGTGDATQVGLAELDLHDGGYGDDDNVLVLPGDTPLITSDTIARLVAAHGASGAAVTMVTVELDDPRGYGRVVRNATGDVAKIVEERDASDEQRQIVEVNAGVYCMRRSLLAPALRLIDTNNASGELYLTDVVGVLADAGHVVKPFEASAAEMAGVNDLGQLAAASEILQRRIIDVHQRAGVKIELPTSQVIEAEVLLDPSSEILSGCVLRGTTTVGSGARVGPGAHLANAVVGDDATIVASTVSNTEVAPGESVGPYAHLHG